MLRKDLLRVSRAGGGYRPQFTTREHRPLAAKVLGTFESHVGERRGDLDDALDALEARNPIDCVVSDYEMPGDQTGLEFPSRGVSRAQTTPVSRFVLFTGEKVARRSRARLSRPA
ncbi:DUF790 family protein, partial [Halorubrum sp. CBA1125]|uniref:DUF790 family protein n=1 Tax=Halorubrum sp. CBA1125 TaxID=2668072 RepID=UPI002AA2A5FA